MSKRVASQVQGPVLRRVANPSPGAEDNPRRRRRKGGRRRRKNPAVSYKNAALIGAALGAVGVAIASATKDPMPVITGTDGNLYAVSPDSMTMRTVKGAARGAALGLALGVAAAVVAKHAKFASGLSKVMNPAGPGSAIILGSTVGVTTLALDHGLSKVIKAA